MVLGGCDSPTSWLTYAWWLVLDERSSSRRRKFFVRHARRERHRAATRSRGRRLLQQIAQRHGKGRFTAFTDYTSPDSNNVIVISSVDGEPIDRLHRGTWGGELRGSAAGNLFSCVRVGFLRVNGATWPGKRAFHRPGHRPARRPTTDGDREQGLTWLASGMWAARS
ncbi:MAG TPA: hypothetical protein VIX73_02280 [Kofleriaceae bacterium]